MAEVDPVIVELKAKVDGYRAELLKTTKMVRTQLTEQERSIRSLEAQFKQSSGAISSSMKTMAASLAGALSVREVQKMADGYTRFTSALKVAGLEGNALAQSQENLFGIAQKYGTELEAVGTLYGRAAMNAKELGASQADLVNFTEAVSAGLKITNTSTQEASGSLLQLGQALGSPRVQAEEFNSLLDTMQPLLREASKHIDGTGGTLAGLTQKLKNTKGPGVSNVELFTAITKSLEDLQRTAANSGDTIGSAFTKISNALTKYIGEMDKSLGATAMVTGGLAKLAENIDTIIPALAVIASVMGGRLVASMLAAAASSVGASGAVMALQLRMMGAVTTAEALAFSATAAGRALLAAFGGPVGIAISAATVALGYFTVQSAKAAQASQELKQRTLSEYEALKLKRMEAEKAAAATGQMTEKQRQALTATANLTGEVKLLATAWGRVAAEAKKAEITQARALLQAAKKDFREARTGFNSKRDSNYFDAINSAAYASGGVYAPGTEQRARDEAQRKMDGSEETRLLSMRTELLADANKNLQEILDRRLETFKPDPSSPTGDGKKDNKKGPKGPTAEQLAQEALQRRQEERANDIEVKRAQADITTDLQERADLEREMLHLERAQRQDDLDSRKDLNAEERKARQETIDALYGKVSKDSADGDIEVNGNRGGLLQQRQNIERQERLDREALDVTQASIDNQRDLLSADANLADKREDRLALEMKLLDLAYQQERAELQAVKDSLTASEAQKQIAQARLAILGQLQARDTESANRQYESPLDQYRREIGNVGNNLNDHYQDIAVNGLKSLNDGLTDAIMNAENFGDVFSNVAKQVIADMIRMAIQQTIVNGLIGAIGGALGPKTANQTGIIMPGRGYASGGYTGDGPVNEPAGIVHKGEYVIPANAVKRIGVQNLAALANGNIAAAASMANVSAVRPAAAAGGGTIKVQIMMDNDVFTARVQEASAPVAVEVYRQSAPGIVQAASAETIRQMNRGRL